MPVLFKHRGDVPRIDCFRLLTDLQRWNVNASEVAERLNVPRSTLQHWKDGVEPKYSDGCRLIELHAQIGAAHDLPEVASGLSENPV